jgi:hypothetical protein
MAELKPEGAHQPDLRDLGVFWDVLAGGVLARCVAAIADLRVADVLGDDGRTAEELASEVGAHAAMLGRVLRFVAAHGIFSNDDGRFRHNARSRLLRSDHPMSVASTMRLMTDAWPLLGALDHTLRNGRPAAEKAVGGDYWTYLATHSDVAQRFDEGMSSKALGQIASLMPIYDFSAFRSVADVGGGRGHFIKAILGAYPNITGVLFDLPQVIASLAGPPDVRLKLQAGNFFRDDISPCDAFLLMNVLHDWNDEECVSILRNLRRQATPTTRLLIAEAPLPEVDGPPHPALMMDVFMMVYATGRERKQSEYRTLLDASGWRLDRMVAADGGMAMLESSPV